MATYLVTVQIGRYEEVELAAGPVPPGGAPSAGGCARRRARLRPAAAR